MAQEVDGLSYKTVRNICRRHGLMPYRCRQFKLSNDPRFAEKIRDVNGLFVAQPDHALVLSIDEKTQIQALARTQASLPMKAGQPMGDNWGLPDSSRPTRTAALKGQPWTFAVVGADYLPRFGPWKCVHNIKPR